MEDAIRALPQETSLPDLLEEQAAVLSEIEAFRNSLAAIESEIAARLKEPMDLKLREAGKDTGTVHFEVDGIFVKATIQKTVKWDQEKLASLCKRMADSGQDPAAWMEIEDVRTYKVPEVRFAKFPEWAKKAFLPARELKPGRPKFEFTPKLAPETSGEPREEWRE